MHEAEEKFPPKPGGMVDTFRREETRIKEQLAGNDEHGVIEEDAQGYAAIRVQVEQPDVFAAKTVTVGAGKTALLLPADRLRDRALIWVNTTGASVVVAKTRPDADNGAGATLVQGMPPVELRTRAAVFVSNQGTTSVSVSAVSEAHQP